MLSVERFENGAVTILRASGEIDETGIEALRRELSGCVADQCRNVVLNLSRVVFLSYMGAGVLVESLGQLRAGKGDLKLACMNMQSRRLLCMMGLGHIFECHDSEIAAVQGYQQEAA
jgi:anti-anti-sigma factor